MTPPTGAHPTSFVIETLQDHYALCSQSGIVTSRSVLDSSGINPWTSQQPRNSRSFSASWWKQCLKRRTGPSSYYTKQVGYSTPQQDERGGVRLARFHGGDRASAAGCASPASSQGSCVEKQRIAGGGLCRGRGLWLALSGPRAQLRDPGDRTRSNHPQHHAAARVANRRL